MAGNISFHKSKDLVWKNKRGRILTKVSMVVMLVVLSHVQLFVIPWSVANHRQEYWSGVPFPPPEDLPTQGSNPCLLHLLYWQAGSLPLHHLESPKIPVTTAKCSRRLGYNRMLE